MTMLYFSSACRILTMVTFTRIQDSMLNLNKSERGAGVHGVVYI